MSNGAQNSSRLYRVAYEAFSQFSNKVSRCSSLEEMGEVMHHHLKYFLNFRVIRIAVEQNGKFLFFALMGEEAQFDLEPPAGLMPYEKVLYEKEIPIRTSEIPEELLAQKLKKTELRNPVLWGWTIRKNNRKLLVSLLADNSKPFATGDIELLKLAVDSFEAKLHEIELKRQLDKKNRTLTEALETIQLQNEKIQAIVENQKLTIEERTREIASKNEKLLHISALNAHNVREPLSRIQGIIQLFEVFDDRTCREELIPKLISSAEEMDGVLREVIQMASRELVELKAKKL